MKLRWAILLLFGAVVCVGAETLDLSELLEEVDFAALAELTGADEAKLRDAARDLQQELQGEYVVTLFSAEELRFVIPPPKLELPVKPESLPLWPPPARPDWPVGAEAYVRQLKPIFVEEGVPAELVWLAEVESNFQPWARSRAGAAGLFQLMPDTAELLGLSLKPVDERFVPAKNARAAARYLKYLHDKFGDWRLTLAAYNAGEGRVRRLMEQHRTRDFDRIALQLPGETQRYVPKFEATLLRREGMALDELRKLE